ncbi:MAG: glycosyltransferase family 2 protein [bacterium]
MIPPPPSVSVIIVNYNTPELVRVLIDSLQTQTATALEILVIDNGRRRFRPSPGESRTRVWHLNHNLGFGQAVNLAARFAAAPYLLLANSDCQIDSDAVAQLTDFLDSRPEVGACAPCLLYPDGNSHASARELPTFANIGASRRSLWRKGEPYTREAVAERIEVPAVSATFFLIRRELFEQLGGFDPHFFMYVEDTDLCRRIRESGKSIYYLGDLTVRHLWGASGSQRRWQLTLAHHHSIRYYFRKHFGGQRLANCWFTIKLAANLIATSLLLLVVRREK